MKRHLKTLFGLALAATAAASARAEFMPTVLTGIDAGVDPGSPSVNSDAAAQSFRSAVGPAVQTVVDFGPAFAGLQPTENNTPSRAVDGLRVTTEGIAYNTPPPHYQYGITSSADPVANSATLGFNVGGTSSHYEFVPLLNAGTASFTIHSDLAFQSFGFYITGLGNVNGVVDVALDGMTLPALRQTGSPTGGALFVGYVGSTPAHDLSIVMPDVSGPSRDVFGLSNVELAGVVPEPSSFVLTGLGLAGALGVIALRGRRPGGQAG